MKIKDEGILMHNDSDMMTLYAQQQLAQSSIVSILQGDVVKRT